VAIRRPWITALIGGVALALAGCGGDSTPNGSASQTNGVPSDDDTPPIGSSDLVRQWESVESPTDIESYGEYSASLKALLAPELPIPANGDPFEFSDGESLSLRGTEGESAITCPGPGGYALGLPLADGATGGKPDLTEDDLTLGEEWFEDAATAAGWTIVSKEPRWTEGDMAWDYGGRATVYVIEGHGQSWYASPTLDNKYSMSMEYCPIG